MISSEAAVPRSSRAKTKRGKDFLVCVAKTVRTEGACSIAFVQGPESSTL